jgi:uncharacterized lipoprotein YmbA
MKTSSLCFSILILALVGLTGCAKKDTVDTAPLEKSFQAAEPAKQDNANQTVAAIKAGDYGAALTSLQRLAGQAGLTPEQQTAIKDTLTALQKKVAETAQKMADEGKKAVDEGKKALDDATKSLPKL